MADLQDTTIPRPALSIVIPCYNEAGNVDALLEKLAPERLSDIAVEVILVDNGSSDETATLIAKRLADGSLPHVRMIGVTTNIGYGHGIISGVREARGSHIAWTHADLQCDPADAVAAYRRLQEAGEVPAIVKGARRNRAPLDAFFTFGMSIFVFCVLRIWLSDINGQPKLFRRAFLERMTATPDDFSLDLYLLALARREGYRILAVPVVFAQRHAGEAKGGGTLRGKMKLVRRTMAYVLELGRRGI